MLVLQILAAIVLLGLIALAVLAFIEPGPLDRRSRDRQGNSPVQSPDEIPTDPSRSFPGDQDHPSS